MLGDLLFHLIVHITDKEGRYLSAHKLLELLVLNWAAKRKTSISLELLLLPFVEWAVTTTVPDC